MTVVKFYMCSAGLFVCDVWLLSAFCVCSSMFWAYDWYHPLCVCNAVFLQCDCGQHSMFLILCSCGQHSMFIMLCDVDV